MEYHLVRASNQHHHQDFRLLAELQCRFKGNLDELSLTICSGTDMVNINYTHIVGPTAEIAKVYLSCYPILSLTQCGFYLADKHKDMATRSSVDYEQQ